MNDTTQVLYQVGANICDLMFSINKLTEELMCAQRPSTLMRPTLGIDGNQWCALYGPNLMEGIAGFGDTPELAMCDFDNQFRTAKVPRSAT